MIHNNKEICGGKVERLTRILKSSLKQLKARPNTMEKFYERHARSNLRLQLLMFNWAMFLATNLLFGSCLRLGARELGKQTNRLGGFLLRLGYQVHGQIVALWMKANQEDSMMMSRLTCFKIFEKRLVTLFSAVGSLSLSFVTHIFLVAGFQLLVLHVWVQYWICEVRSRLPKI